MTATDFEWFRSWYGPTQAAFAALDEDRRIRPAAELIDVYFYNRADDGTLVAPPPTSKSSPSSADS